MTVGWSGPDALLMVSASAMGLAGSWHCALMCGPLCASVGPRTAWSGFLVGRLLSYAVIGAVLASAASWATNFVIRGGAGALSPWLMLWAMAHAAVLSLGVWLMWTGRQPLWWATLGQRRLADSAAVRWVTRAPRTATWALAGSLWAMLPCGLLQSAFVVAALASSAPSGALVMGAFALASTPGLLVAPAMIAWLERLDEGGRWKVRMTRLSGLMLAGAAAWTLVHGLWIHVRDYC